jgi:cytoskeletal protein CcmA (bactofilin family)
MKKTNTNDSGGIMNTIIGKDTVITGTLDVKGALRIDGSVKGKIISSDCVTIGATGTVEADIQADTAIIAGHLIGNVNCRENRAAGQVRDGR